jgi:hypothetical protein
VHVRLSLGVIPTIPESSRHSSANAGEDTPPKRPSQSHLLQTSHSRARSAVPAAPCLPVQSRPQTHEGLVASLTRDNNESRNKRDVEASASSCNWTTARRKWGTKTYRGYILLSASGVLYAGILSERPAKNPSHTSIQVRSWFPPCSVLPRHAPLDALISTQHTPVLSTGKSACATRQKHQNPARNLTPVSVAPALLPVRTKHLREHRRSHHKPAPFLTAAARKSLWVAVSAATSTPARSTILSQCPSREPSTPRGE